MLDQKPRILIVEDEPGIADTLQYVLRTDGFEPVWCATGEAGAGASSRAAAAGAGDPRRRPARPERLRAVQAPARAAADVPMVFLTARSDEIDRVVGLELGADDYIAKPFSPRELVARVRTHPAARAPAGRRRARGAPRRCSRSRSTTSERQIRFYGRAAGALALRVRPAADAGARGRAACSRATSCSSGLGRRQRQPRPHRRRARQDAARQAEGGGARRSSRSARSAAAATRWPKTCRASAARRDASATASSSASC